MENAKLQHLLLWGKLEWHHDITWHCDVTVLGNRASTYASSVSSLAVLCLRRERGMPTAIRGVSNQHNYLYQVPPQHNSYSCTILPIQPHSVLPSPHSTLPTHLHVPASTGLCHYVQGWSSLPTSGLVACNFQYTCYGMLYPSTVFEVPTLLIVRFLLKTCCLGQLMNICCWDVIMKDCGCHSGLFLFFICFSCYCDC